MVRDSYTDGNALSYLRAPTPLLMVSVSLILGILAACFRVDSFFIFAAIWCASLLAAGILLLYMRRLDSNAISRKALRIVLCLGFIGLGGMRYVFHCYYYPHDHILRLCLDDRQRPATLRGTVISAPTITRPRGAMGDFDFLYRPQSIFDLNCEEILAYGDKGGENWKSISGNCRVVLREARPNLHAGDRVEIVCLIGRRSGEKNPGEFRRSRRFHAGRNLVYAVVDSAEGVDIRQATAGKQVAENPGRKIRALIDVFLNNTRFDYHRVADDRQAAALLDALMLGRRENLAQDLYDSFMQTGTAHFLSVSGFHVGLVVGFVWWGGWLLRLPRFYHGLLCLLVTVAYILIVPARPPILRAGIIGIVFSLAYMSRRQGNPLNLLAFSALVILFWRPTDLFNPGFQLSFVVVLGLIVLSPAVFSRRFAGIALSDEIDDQIKREYRDRTLGAEILAKLGQTLWGLLVVSLVAWIVSLPLAATHFNRIAGWGILGSIVMFPLVSLTMFLGLLGMVFNVLLPSAADVVLGFSAQTGNLIIACNRLLARLPVSCLHTAVPPGWLFTGYYAMLLWAAVTIRQKGRIGRSALYGWLATMILFIGLAPFRPWKNGQMLLHVLAIGHGTCSVVELPDGSTIIYDVGSLTNFDLARQTVIPFLRSRGIQRVDAVFISHANLDHYNGLIDMCRGFPVRRIYAPVYWQQQQGRSEQFVTRQLESLHQSMVYLQRNDRIQDKTAGDSFTIEVIWPPPGLPRDIDANETSLVLRISGEKGTILLCGDIEERAQRWLLEHEEPEHIHADVMLLPHHGAPIPTLADLISASGAKCAVNSTGKMSLRRRQELERLLNGIPVYHTFEHGYICVSFKDELPRLSTFQAD